MNDAGQKFEKANGKYPKSREEFKPRQKEFTDMYNRVSRYADTQTRTEEEFVANIEGLFLDKPYVANAKLIQLAFLDAVYGISDRKKREEVWTDIVFLAIKKGNKFGPFGKLY